MAKIAAWLFVPRKERRRKRRRRPPGVGVAELTMGRAVPVLGREGFTILAPNTGRDREWDALAAPERPRLGGGHQDIIAGVEWLISEVHCRRLLRSDSRP